MSEVDFSDKALLKRVPQGDLRAVSRLITLTENGIERAHKITSELFKQAKKAHVIGVTGSPGAGKSTLVDQLAKILTSQGKKVAILAVDPSSPFSGGAILGDRIRMMNAQADSNVFIRSMATRGSLGGLSRATYDAMQILEAAQFDTILVETVGVGQAEIDIARTADTCLVVIVPGMGDSVQAFKAGILEIADLFVINKSDREGADLLERDLLTLLSVAEPVEGEWKPPILRTVATTGQGAQEVISKTMEHFGWLASSEQGKTRRRGIVEHQVKRIAQEIVLEKITGPRAELLRGLVDRCLERKIDPHAAARELVKGG